MPWIMSVYKNKRRSSFRTTFNLPTCSPLSCCIRFLKASGLIALFCHLSYQPKGASLGSGARTIMVLRERREAQLFNLSTPFWCRAGFSCSGESLNGSLRITYFSKDPGTNTCKQTSGTRRDLMTLRYRCIPEPVLQRFCGSAAVYTEFKRHITCCFFSCPTLCSK